MNELRVTNYELRVEDSAAAPLETTDEFGARVSVPEKLSEMPTSEEFARAAQRARRERHLSAVLNAQLYGRGNKEVDALVNEFADAKAMTGDEDGYWTSQEDKDMRLGGKVARDFNDGDVWGTLKGLEGRIPEEERESWRMELRACDTETKGKVLLGKTLRGMAEKRWAQMEEERKEAEGLPDAVKNELADYVISGQFSPELMGKVDKFKAMDALAPSLGRARAAYEWMLEMQHGGEKGEYEARVKQEADRLEEEWKNGVHARWDAERTRDDFIEQAKANVGESYEITRNDILQLVELLKDEDGKLDEGALAGVVLALNRDAEGQQSIDSRFLRNFVEGGKRWFMSTADWMNRNNARNGFIWTGPDTAPIYLTKEQQEEYQAEYSPEVEKALDGLRQLEDARLSAADKAIWYSKVASGLGTIAGQNIPFFASAALGGNIGMLAGTAAMFPDIANREIGSAYARGEKHPELVGNITGLMQAGAEGMFGRLAGGNKLVGRLLDKGAAGLVSVPVLGKALSAIQGNALMRYVAGSGVVEGAGELFIEDATAETLSYLTLGGLRKLGVDIKEQEFAPLGHAWENFKEDPYQAAATVAYCMIMGAFGAGHIMRSAKEFAMRTEVTQAAGLKAASARRLAQMAQSETVTEAEFKKEAMRLYEEDVINGDPVELKKRLEAQGKKFLEQAEVLMYARSGVRDYILQESGILNPEQNGDGTYHVVRQVKDVEGKEQTVESDWTEEQLNAYVSMRRGSMMEEAMREMQARMQGTAMAQAEMSDEERAKGEIIAMQNVPTAALAEMKKNGGRITYNVLKALAAEAAAKVEGYVAEGMSREEAEGQESAVRGVSLRSLMGAAEGFRQRVEAMQGTAEGKAMGITPETASTAVFRLGGMSAGQSVLLYNRGHVNEREMVEDSIERDLGAEVTSEEQMQELGKLLKRVEEGLMKIDKGMRLLPEGRGAGAPELRITNYELRVGSSAAAPQDEERKYTRQDIIEAFSTLAQSHFLLNHGRYNMPQEAHDSIEYVQKKLADAQHLVAISEAWDAFAKSKEGRAFIKNEGATLEKLMEESGASVAGRYAAAKLDATVFEAVREAYEEGSSITRAAEVLEEYAKEQEELRITNYELRVGSSRADAREGIGAADSPTGEAIDAEAMSGEPTSEEERLDGLLADVEEMERAQEIAAAGMSGRNADEIEAKERYVGTEAAKAVEKVVTSLRGKVKDAVTREELEERVPVEERKGLISQEEELIMPANEGVIDAVKAATGRDVTGYYHAVSEEKIWHAMQGHSHDSANDKYPNQLDLTWDDFALLPDILDSGVPEVEKREGEAPVIIYTKDYGDVRYKVVQKIGRKHRSSTSKLMFVTEWIQKVERGQGLAPGAARGNAPSSPLTGIQSRGVADVKGKNLVNGMYAEAGDGSVYGVARVEDLSISADVPQFKKKEVAGQREAANEDGTTHELSGGWNAKSAPIIVWRRRDGRLEVISGRHRLAHAKKNGVGHIAVRVYDEDAAHDAAWAKLYDVEVNILEGMCNAIDVAFYFRHNPMSIAEAEARGLMPKTQAGGQTAASRMGIMIATRASGYVFDSLVNGGVSAEDAYMACVITESAEGQELALKARRGTKGKKRSWEYVTALVRGAEQMAPEGGGSLTDLFGFDEGFANRAKKMADYVEAVRKQLRRRIEVLSGAGSLQRKGEMTREMGVKIDRPEDAVKIIERLARLDAAYEAMDPELGIAEAAESWDGKSEVWGAVAPYVRGTMYDVRFGNSAAAPLREVSGNGEQVESGGSFSMVDRRLFDEVMRSFRQVQREGGEMKWESMVKKGKIFRICGYPDVFRKVMDWERDIIAPSYIVRKLLNEHAFTPEDVARLPYALWDPVAIFEEGRNGKDFVVVTDIRTRNNNGDFRNALAVLSLRVDGDGARITDLRTAYAPDAANKYVNLLEGKALRYVDKARARVWANEEGSTISRLLTTSLEDPGSGVMLKEDLQDVNFNFATNEEESDFSSSVRNLAAVHTINHDDFINAADELGGMPLPSVAVTRLDRPYRWGDDETSVTLVARPDMVDPRRGTDVYARDAWTGRMPRIETEMDGEDFRTFFYDEEGEKVDATLENLTDYLYGRKRRGNEATERELDLTWTAKAYLARRMRDMDDVKGQRERLQGEDEVRVMSEDIWKWMDMLHEYDVWLGDEEWIGVFEALADLDEVTEGSVREAIMNFGGTDGWADLSALQNSEAMEEGSDFIAETVRILRELRAEKTDYLEAVPRRAVEMNEWAYALFSDKVGNKESVRRVCRENGIVPVEYKAGERDRALGDLIDNAEVSFSVSEARERGMMRDGRLEAVNGVIVDGGANFDLRFTIDDLRFGSSAPAAQDEGDFSASVDFSHVSRALFRKPDREHVGSGEGNAAFGWGCIYGAESPETNRFYHGQFSVDGGVFVQGLTRDGKVLKREDVIAGLRAHGVTRKQNLDEADAWWYVPSKEAMIEERENAKEEVRRWENWVRIAEERKDDLMKRMAVVKLEYWKQDVLVADYFVENDILVRRGEERYPVNYRMRADVDDSNLLHWDRGADEFINEHADVANAIQEVLGGGGMELRGLKGEDIYWKLAAALGSARAASEWLDAHGIRGIKYADGATRHKEGEKAYNYVIFNPDYIEVIAINNRHPWSEYSEDNADWERVEDVFNEDGEMSASVAMWKGTLEALRESFPEKGTEAYMQDILVCPTPAVMRMVGARELDMVITPAVIRKVTEIKHGVPYEALEQLPEAMADPVCIAVSDTANALEVITELVESTEAGDRNILVAVHLDVEGSGSRGLRVNRIASLYGKEQIAKLLTHPMLYWNETKASTWTGRPGLQLPRTPYPVKAYDRRIREPRDLVKYKMRHGMSFSVRGEGLLDRVNLREMAEEEKMSRLMTRARRGAARWRRVFMDDKTSAADAARALGEVSSVMEAVYAYLPAGERPSYARKMKLVEAYARLVETGRVWHRENAKSEGARAKQEVLDEVMGELEKVGTLKGEALREVREGYVREVAGRKLSEVAVSMVEDAVDAVERHLVRREMDVVKRLAEALKPKKLKSGKLAPGKMSAEGYRRFGRYMKMVEMSAGKKAERMEELAGKLEKESEAEGQEPIEEEMRELATFGALGSGRLADVRRGVAELIGFVRAERTSWEGRVELEKEQMAHFARVAVEAMGGVDRNKLAAKRDRAKKPLRTILGTQKGFMSLGQMWMAMQGVPALRGLAEWSLERLARGNVALGMRERALREAEVAFMAQELGLTSEAARNDFLVDLKRERATGVRKAGEKRVHKVRVTIEEAREIVAMSKEERKARNERIRKEAEERGVDAKNIVEDEDVELMMEALRDVGRKKYITTEREYRTEGSEELVLSKDNALNLILLAEQADYAESADAQGYTAEVIEGLRGFVGKEALAYGYWMRERLGNNGLAEVWEAREGIPFPAVEDYWPGRFDQSGRINERSALDGMSGGRR